jgi:biotin operon repressor
LLVICSPSIVVAGQYGSEYMTSCVTYCDYRGRVRASRLVSLLGLLQARGRMSTRQLAAELEVCERTVLRDIEALSTAGIPVYATRGRHGGFELMDGFSSDLVGGRRRGEAPPGPLAAGDGVQRALIRLSPRGRRLAALLGRPAGLHIRRHPAPARAADPAADPAAGPADWAEAWIRIDSPDTAVLDLLALGAEVEVVRPPELRAQMAQIARQIAARHAADGGRDAQGASRAGAGS